MEGSVDAVDLRPAGATASLAMPQRSTDFQHLVAVIESQLAGEGVTVIESRLIRDSHGTDREVDIAVEGSINGHRLLIAVETRERGRPANNEWIDALVGKYAYLPVDKVVAVSKSGFAESVRERAAATMSPRIELITLDQALATDWTSFFAQLTEITDDWLLPDGDVGNVIVHATAGTKAADLVGLDYGKGVLQFDDHQVALVQFINDLVRSDQFLQTAQSIVPPNSRAVVGAQVSFPQPRLLSVDGRSLRIEGLEVHVPFRREQRRIPLTHGSYAGAHIAYGTNEVMGRKVAYTFTQNEAQKSGFTMSFEGNASEVGPMTIELHGENLENLKVESKV